MKRFEKVMISGFLLAVVFSFLGFSANCERISEKVLRLHVLANSDSEYDQRVKLAVKDRVSLFAEELLEDAENLAESEKIVSDNLQNIEAVANEKLAGLHTGYQAKAVLETAYFGTRNYQNFSLPAGEYKALRLLLGEGKGENWWCVVYPALCFSASAKDFTEFSEHENRILQNPSDFRVSFRLYEWYCQISQLFQADGIA